MDLKTPIAQLIGSAGHPAVATLDDKRPDVEGWLYRNADDRCAPGP